MALVLTAMARSANSKVECDSSWCKTDDDTQAQIVVLQLPPSDSVRSLVNVLSRNGMKLLGLFWAKAETHKERDAIDLLIVLASRRRRPSLPVLLNLSLPARSTIVSNAFL